MSNDAVFRWVMLATFAAAIGITARHPLKPRTHEKLDRTKEGTFILVTLRPVAAALYASIIAYMSNPASMAWSQVTLPMWVRWSGVAFGALHSTGPGVSRGRRVGEPEAVHFDGSLQPRARTPHHGPGW